MFSIRNGRLLPCVGPPGSLLGTPFEALVGLLKTRWGRPRALLRRPGRLGPSLGLLGARCGQLGGFLWPSWGCLGSLLGLFELPLGLSRGSLGHF